MISLVIKLRANASFVSKIFDNDGKCNTFVSNKISSLVAFFKKFTGYASFSFCEKNSLESATKILLVLV